MIATAIIYLENCHLNNGLNSYTNILTFIAGPIYDDAVIKELIFIASECEKERLFYHQKIALNLKNKKNHLNETKWLINIPKKNSNN